MRAIVYDKYGPPNVLRIEERPKPKPVAGELLVRVRAAEVTKTDCELRGFSFAVAWFWLPLRLVMGVFRPRKHILGMYFAGQVEAVGEQVTRFAPGDSVFGSSQMRLGAYAEYVCVPEKYTLTTIPQGASFEQAAAIPLGGLNAIHFMRLAHIQPGDRVLVVGAGGSIGSFALQIAKSMGAHVTVVDAPHKEAGLRRLGADEFIDYTKSAFWQQSEKYDVILNMVAKTPFTRALQALKPEGRYLLGNPTFGNMLLTLWTNLTSSKKASFAMAAETLEELSTLKGWTEEGKIQSCIDRVYSPEQVAQAHERVEREERVGCVVLKHD